jgi:hypothetical protein
MFGHVIFGLAAFGCVNFGHAMRGVIHPRMLVLLTLWRALVSRHMAHCAVINRGICLN